MSIYAAQQPENKKIKDPNVYQFKEGGIWEDEEFEIVKDYKCSDDHNFKCKHSRSFKITRDKNGHKKATFICPYVVIARNEGGFNSTGVCLECIIEASKSVIK